MELSFMYNFTA